MPEGIEQYIKKLAQDAYSDLEKGNIKEAKQRVILIADTTKRKWFRKNEYENKEINKLVKHILKLFEEANFREAEELLMEIYNKTISDEEFKKRKIKINPELYNTVQGISSLGYLCIHDSSASIGAILSGRIHQENQEEYEKRLKKAFDNIIFLLENQGTNRFQLSCSAIHPKLNIKPIGW